MKKAVSYAVGLRYDELTAGAIVTKHKQPPNARHGKIRRAVERGELG